MDVQEAERAQPITREAAVRHFDLADVAAQSGVPAETLRRTR